MKLIIGFKELVFNGDKTMSMQSGAIKFGTQLLATAILAAAISPVVANPLLLKAPDASQYRQILPKNDRLAGVILKQPTRNSGCPDLSVIMHQETRPDGSIDVTYGVKNVGRADFMSGRKQQMLYLQANGESKAIAFTDVKLGETVTWHDVRQSSDTPVTYSATIQFDPDIHLDGNFMNDDCNSANDRALLTTLQ
jgi:hypothetical protein